MNKGRNEGIVSRLFRRVPAVIALVAGIGAICSNPAGAATANIVYSTGTSTPQYRGYNPIANTFGAAAATVAGGAQTFVVDRSCSTRNEHVAGYVTTGGVLYIMRWNGTSWSNEWNVTIPNYNGVTGKRFDIAYRNGGSAMVVYSTGTARQFAYRIWDGTAWTAAANVTMTTLSYSGSIASLKLIAKPNAAGCAVAALDTSGNLASMIYNATWGNEKLVDTGVYRSTSYGDVPAFDLAYETGSGKLMVVNGTGSSSVNYAYFNGTAWNTTSLSVSTGGGYSPPNTGAVLAAADPNAGSNNILIAATEPVNNNQVTAWVWNGSAFSAANTSISMGSNLAANRMPLAGGFLKSGTTTAAVLANNSGSTNQLGYAYTTNGGTSWTTGTAGVTVGATKAWIDAMVNPNSSDTMMVTLSDSNSDLWAKRLMFTAPSTFAWTNADGGTALSTALGSITTQNFSFSYDRMKTILGEGVAGTPASICPSAAGQKIGGFALSTSMGTDSVTGLTVTTTGQTAIAGLQIWDEAGTTQYFGTVNNPGSETWTFTGGTAIPVTATPANFKILATYKSNTAAPQGSTATSAYVSTFTAGYPPFGSDMPETTITLDNLAASSAVWGTNSGGTGSATLNWSKAFAGDGVMVIRYTANTDTTMPVDGTAYTANAAFGTGGTIVYVGTAATFADNGNGALLAGGTYYYRIFEYDSCGNFSTTAPWSSVAVTSPTPTAAGTATATAATSTSIAVSMTYSGDTNANNSLIVDYKLTSVGTWTRATSATHPASPWNTTISGLTSGASYDVRCTWSDTNGVSGTAVQTITPVVLPMNSTTAGTATAIVKDATSIEVVMPYTNDYNGNNSYTVEYRTTGLGSWTAWVTNAPHAASPYRTTITGLASATGYDIRATWTDPDGVTNGQQTINHVDTPVHSGNVALMHNSANTGSGKWASSGGWGVAGGQYGMFDCATCHIPKTSNIERIRTAFSAPDISKGNLPGGSNSPVSFPTRNGLNAFATYSASNSTSQKVCETCHSQTYVHKYNQTTIRSHEGSGGGTCTVCHKHSQGFKPIGGCTICHARPQGNRAAVVNQFGASSHHIQGATLTDLHCYQCHWEANSDGSMNSLYHGGGASPGSPVNLVVYGTGTRPVTYKNISTAVSYTANGTRIELQKVNTHCLGCHSTKNSTTKPFGDGKTPQQYAWDSKSIDERYSQTGTTQWGKYTGGTNITPKNGVTKALSAHGNAIANQRGWSTTTETWPNTSGAVSVVCADCHNSHGSTVTGTATSYTSATPTGGLLKDTTAGLGGYTMSYKPAAGGSAGTYNAYNAGAAICFDCHLTSAPGTKPWGYSGTFGATQAVMGYMDTSYFGAGTFGRQQHFPYKVTSNKGGHFGASSALSPPASKAIGGLCTPCHDPHGVSPTLGVNQAYGVPLLKGTWLTTPYKEDVTPTDNQNYIAIGAIGYTGEYEGPTRSQTKLDAQKAAMNAYKIDQNTFGPGGAANMNSTAYKISEADTQFAGLCLGCHQKSSLTNGTTHTWKGKDRIHESVKGWKTANATIQHNFSCSKCHAPHNASLPRLMVTNCLDYEHRGRVTNATNPVTSGSYRKQGYGSGKIPGSYSARVGESANWVNNKTFICHESNDTGQKWNTKTPWVQ